MPNKGPKLVKVSYTEGSAKDRERRKRRATGGTRTKMEALGKSTKKVIDETPGKRRRFLNKKAREAGGYEYMSGAVIGKSDVPTGYKKGSYKKQ